MSLAVGYCSARYLSSIDQPLEVWIFRVNFCGLLAIVTGFVISFFFYLLLFLFLLVAFLLVWFQFLFFCCCPVFLDCVPRAFFLLLLLSVLLWLLFTFFRGLGAVKWGVVGGRKQREK